MLHVLNQSLGLYTVRYGQFLEAFLHCTYRSSFPSSLTTPHLWNGGYWSTQGVVQIPVRCD